MIVDRQADTQTNTNTHTRERSLQYSDLLSGAE